MARFFAQLYPSLAGPEKYEQEADALLAKLHELDYFTLSFVHTPIIAAATIAACEKRLAEASTVRYKDVLTYKLNLYKEYKGSVTPPETIAAVNRETMDYLDTVRAVMRSSNGPWVYGKYGLTALDAHLVAFLRRMKDAGHFDFFDDLLDRYLVTATSTAEWNQVMQGRRTLPQWILVDRKENM